MSILKFKCIILRARSPLSIVMISACVFNLLLFKLLLFYFDMELIIIIIGTFDVEL